MPESQWYYAKDDQQYGPVSASELRDLVAAGGVAPEDYLWREGMDEWRPAATVKGLFDSEFYPPSPIPIQLTPRPDSAPVGDAREAFVSEVPSIHVPPPLHSDAARFVTLVQATLWGLCILVLLFGGIRFAWAFTSAKTQADEQAACIVFATFCLASYIVARVGEKVALLIHERSARPRP